MSFVWGAVAIGGGAVLNYLGSQNAASAQTNAANQANATQQSQYNQNRSDQLPWMNRGNAAGNQMAYLLGLPGYGVGGSAYGSGTTTGNVPSGLAGLFANGGGTTTTGANPFQPNTAMGGYGSLATPFSQTDWTQDPGYAFRLAEGQKALERSGAARGMTLSGAQQKALIGYGQGMGSQEYGAAYNRYNNDQTNLYNRLAGVAGTGQTATNMTGQLGANMANNVSANQMNLGNGLAASGMAGMNALSGGLNGMYNSWQNQNNWTQLMNSQGLGASGYPTGGTYNGAPYWGQGGTNPFGVLPD